MSLRDDVAAIVERLESIEQIFLQYSATIVTAQERDRELKPRAEIIRAEVAFDESTKREARNEADRLHAIRNSIRLAAWAAFAAALVYAGVSWNQLREMRLQTEQLIHQSQAATADASYKTLQSLQQQIDIAEQQAATARESVASIQREMMEEQRAWITAHAAGLGSEPLGQPVTITLTYANTGKTPARDVDGIFIAALLNRTDAANLRSPDGSADAYRYNQGVLLPNEQLPMVNVPVRSKAGRVIPFTKDLNDQYAAGAILFMIHGTITYVDAFNMPHWVKFCDSLYNPVSGAAPQPAPAAVAACAAFNGIDIN